MLYNKIHYLETNAIRNAIKFDGQTFYFIVIVRPISSYKVTSLFENPSILLPKHGLSDRKLSHICVRLG